MSVVEFPVRLELEIFNPALGVKSHLTLYWDGHLRGQPREGDIISLDGDASWTAKTVFICPDRIQVRFGLHRDYDANDIVNLKKSGWKEY